MIKSVTKPRIVAICGLKRSGKDTLADYIVSQYGYEHVKVADRLKKVVKLLFNLHDNDVTTNLKDRVNSTWGVKPRDLMDFVGTHVFQHEIQKILPKCGREFWIDGLLSEMDLDKKCYVISDLRFVHEVKRLRDFKPFIVKIERHGCDAEEYESEKECDNLDPMVTIVNDGSVEDLHRKYDESHKKYYDYFK